MKALSPLPRCESASGWEGQDGRGELLATSFVECGQASLLLALRPGAYTSGDPAELIVIPHHVCVEVIPHHVCVEVIPHQDPE